MNWRKIVRALLPRGHKAHKIQSGPLRGKRIVTSWRDYPAAIRGYTEAELLNWFAKHIKPNETWLDIGAHYGYTSLAMCKLVGKSGRIFAFEPLLFTSGCLEKTREVNRLWQWTILPFALSSDKALTLLKLPTTRGMIDSQLAPDKAEGFTQILAVALDSIWAEISQKEVVVHGVKIDVQGMELETLKGMMKVLTNSCPKLILEVHPGVSRQEILSLLSDCGYDSNPKAIEKGAPDFMDLQGNASYSFVPAQNVNQEE